MIDDALEKNPMNLEISLNVHLQVIRIQIFIRRGSFDLNSQRLFLNLDI
jgi:hypothetical protein